MYRSLKSKHVCYGDIKNLKQHFWGNSRKNQTNINAINTYNSQKVACQTKILYYIYIKIRQIKIGHNAMEIGRHRNTDNLLRFKKGPKPYLRTDQGHSLARTRGRTVLFPKYSYKHR
ncbi:uncharacterized protein LOC143195304 [Rhynchophorus ferrugineus]|uniref:uncharacterized protein LOC143195304 n=1 Tax=Rhynchophorus ferrugineus TaxID=354439 RepID=UPI003FCCA059